MIGEARRPSEPPLLAALVEIAVDRTLYAVHLAWGAVQARFKLAPSPPPQAYVGTPVIPTVRYRDVPAAIEWLRRAFGMQVHRVVNDANGLPCYAELTVGSGMLMVAPIEDTPFGKLMVQPDEIGGVETQVCYLCVANARSHYARAKAAGAVIVLDPEDQANRGRGYSCRDPEGHVWNFGTYDPWQKQAPVRVVSSAGLRRVRQGAVALLLLGIGGVLAAQLMPQPSARAGTAVTEPATPAPPAMEDTRQAALEPLVRGVPEKDIPASAPVPEPSSALQEAEREAARAHAQLAEVRSALEKAEREKAAARAEIDALQRARAAAERAAAEARGNLAAAEAAVERVRHEATQERIKRLAAESARIRPRPPIRSGRPRARWPRTWCYSPTGRNPPANTPSRLVGFCKS
jgi:uncharacterized glyoxalase superfamily protein PhnB